MTVNKNDDYEKLAAILYPSIEASGNVYYGQTRKLTMDEILGKNNINFESHIETFNTNHGYDSYFNWKIGPLHGAVRTNPGAGLNDSTFCHIDKLWLLNDSEFVEQDLNTDFTITGTSFAKYKIKLTSNTITNELSSGQYNTYENNVESVFLGIVVTDGISPVDKSTDIGDHNFYVDTTDNTLYIKICDGYVNNNVEYNTTAEIYKPLTLKAVGGDVSVTLKFNGFGTDEYVVEYVINNTAYKNISSEETIELLENDIVQFICIQQPQENSRSSTNYIQFAFTSNNNGTIEASGNVNSLLDSNFEDIDDLTDYGSYTFNSLFKDCTLLTAASKLQLPATTLADNCYCLMFQACENLITTPNLPATALDEDCYSHMFQRCISLKTAPELPATDLADGCYYNMFSDCKSLTIAPELPATTLTKNCYDSMFSGCESLTESPELPATDLADGCYSSMFENCTSLKSTPELPATDLAEYCYFYMFYNCTSLNKVTCYVIDTFNTTCTHDWLYNVASSGTFYTPNEDIWEEGASGIPSDWDIETIETVELADLSTPLCFTNVNDGESTIQLTVNGNLNTSYQYSTDGINYSTYTIGDTITLSNIGDKVYFKGTHSTQNSSNYIQFVMTGKIAASGNVNSLLDSDFENIINLGNYGTYTFYRLFKDCALLTTAPELPATTLANYCYEGMFFNCISLTEAPKLPATALTEYCYFLMFAGCESLTEAPELPATTLADGCYHSMFANCIGLITVPELPVKALASNCYQAMFANCTSLTNAPELPATILAEYCYSGMFNGCISLTTVPELPAATLTTACYSQMFYGCTSLKSIKCNAVNISATNCLSDWLYGVSTPGYCVFIKSEYATFPTESSSGIPTGWSVVSSKYSNSSPLTLTAIGGDVNVELQYHGFVDQTSKCFAYWIDDGLKHIITDTTTVALKKGSCIKYVCFDNHADLNSNNYFMFKFTSDNNGTIEASGNINSLLSPLFGDITDLTEYGDNTFRVLFSGNSLLTNVSNLQLPATALTDNCYLSMFAGCESLTEAPELPATTLADGCYYSMFYGCINLTTAPELPAATLTNYCYYWMFYGCTNLNKVMCCATDITASSCTSNWLYGVSDIGYFYSVNSNYNSNIDTDIWDRDDSGIPTNWYINIYNVYNNKPSILLDTEKHGLMITSGSDSIYNGRGKLNDNTLFNMLSDNPFLNTYYLNPDKHNAYNDYDGSYNQEIWGYKSFNSPVSFRNGIYGELGRLTTFKDDTYEGIQLAANIGSYIRLGIDNDETAIELNANNININGTAKINSAILPHYVSGNSLSSDTLPVGSLIVLKVEQDDTSEIAGFGYTVSSNGTNWMSNGTNVTVYSSSLSLDSSDTSYTTTPLNASDFTDVSFVMLSNCNSESPGPVLAMRIN